MTSGILAKLRRSRYKLVDFVLLPCIRGTSSFSCIFGNATCNFIDIRDFTLRYSACTQRGNRCRKTSQNSRMYKLFLLSRGVKKFFVTCGFLLEFRVMRVSLSHGLFAVAEGFELGEGFGINAFGDGVFDGDFGVFVEDCFVIVATHRAAKLFGAHASNAAAEDGILD